MDELPTLPTPEHGRPLPSAETQPGTDVHGPQRADLADAIAQLQFEIDAVNFAPPGPVTSATWIPPVRSGLVAVPTMKVPKFSWDMKSDDRPDKTIDVRSGMGTLQSIGTSPALESRLPDIVIDLGARGVDAFNPVLGQNHRFGPRSSVRPRRFGHDMTPIPDINPSLHKSNYPESLGEPLYTIK